MLPLRLSRHTRFFLSPRITYSVTCLMFSQIVSRTDFEMPAGLDQKSVLAPFPTLFLCNPSCFFSTILITYLFTIESVIANWIQILVSP